jgi:hypothetical protein
MENLISPRPGLNKGSLPSPEFTADSAIASLPPASDPFTVGAWRFLYDPPLAKMLEVCKAIDFPSMAIDANVTRK